MLKQKVKNAAHSRRLLGVLLIAIVFGGTTFYGGLARADKFDDQIRLLEQQNALKQQKADYFAAQASSYQNAVDRLQSAINNLQAAIDKAQRQSDVLRKQIKNAQAELDHNKKLLGQSIRVMYQEGQISTLEILASSNDLSDFVNKQQYRTAVQDKVKETFDKITVLKIGLEQKQRKLERLIKDKQLQQDTKSQAQAKQNQLLAYSSNQKASFNRQIQANNLLISQKRAAQAAANASHFGGATVPGDPNHGGYPAKWDNIPMDWTSDDWGMFNRECVSYTAWKVFQTFGPGAMPYWGGHGNANQWPASARADRIPTGSTPRIHSVAIWSTGFYGHAMWVEDVYDNGNIRVSQYNYDYQGHYSEMTIPSGGLTYIYFD